MTDNEVLDNLPDGGDGNSEFNPRYRRKTTRVQFALAKFHGMGDEDPWEINEIAEHLGVDRSTVSGYLFDTEIAAEVEEQIAGAQARTRLRLVTDLLSKLDYLQELEEELKQDKKTVTTSHRMEQVTGTASIEMEGFSIEETDNEVTVNAPIPDRFEEVTNISNLKDLWREQRLVREQVEDLLGLEAPEKTESEHREIRQEIKIWEIEGGDRLPDAEVIDADGGAVPTSNPVADADGDRDASHDEREVADHADEDSGPGSKTGPGDGYIEVDPLADDEERTEGH